MNKIKPPKIAIVGLGPSGVAAYVEIVRKYHNCIGEVILFDKKGVGNGLAFTSELECAITNTSVGVTSITAQDNLDFYRWLRNRHPASLITPKSFVPRYLVRDYCRDRLNESILFASEFGSAARIVKEDAKSLAAHGQKIIILDSRGSLYEVDILILATGSGYAEPHADLSALPNYFSCPYPESKFLTRIKPGDNILIMGSKLSAIDAAIAISENTTGAKIIMASPSGALPSVRSEVLVKPTPLFDAKAFADLPQDAIARATFVGAAKTLKRLSTRRNWRNNESSALPQLRNEIDACTSGANNWQFAIANFVDQANDIWPLLRNDQKVQFKKRHKTFIDRYVSSFPLQNAKKLLSLMENSTLQLVKTGEAAAISQHEGKFKGNGALKDYEFDMVINATGLGSKNLSLGLSDSLTACGASFNAYGGIKIDTRTMRVRTTADALPIYAIGGPVAGELLVINYIRSSAIQAMKIGDDLSKYFAREFHANNRETYSA